MIRSYTLVDLATVDGPAVPVRHDGALVLLGPAVGGVCVSCAEHTRLATLGPGVPRGNSHMRLGGLPTPAMRPLLDKLIAEITASPSSYRETVVAVRTDLGTVTHHRVRPRPGGCSTCNPLPEDFAADAPSAPVSPGSLRGDNPLAAGLREELLDIRHGPVAGVFRTGHLPLAVVSAELVGDHVPREAGYGRTMDFADAERVALFESVERHNGMRPQRTGTFIEASFTELGPDRAVDPAGLGRYDPEHIDHPGFGLTPYRPHTRLRWVQGWSFTRQQPVAVPKNVAYWGAGGGPQVIAETSNGCGLGNSLAEAVLHGLFEVAERDAFLMAWYARTPLNRLRVPEGDLPHLVDRLAAIGYELMFFDATNDLGIPAVISVARYQGTSPDAPRIFYAAGAHPDPARAMRSAAAEVVVDVESMVDRVAADPVTYSRDRLLRLLESPELIRTMAEHVMVNALPEAADRHEFLFGQPTVALPEVDAHEFTDLRDLLDDYVARFCRLKLEIVAVDQSDPVTAARLGLYSAKVIVPGTLPMTFGHLHRRTRGLPRLLEVPQKLGRIRTQLAYESLALQPHPFP
ncbi:YcaO-like family protein [Actinocrispum wychmicini]|uniref:Ribosomal protein S12 methylthiotransferase accessory factor n=1 Tax=Actinocrispum wychmicini TaxID=1213861 RepID=A0A4V2S6L6_9PSEU|nr:YcaO-like family protein [Actinocrispum wychmicini]TCO56580.1 ribosomal protein S12 methylthiotransferase accessory factor [Actinocrispum wychmicini]